MRRLVPVLALLTLTVGLMARQAPPINVTSEQILHPTPDSWPTYFGDYSGKRFSALTKITDKNVKNLSLAWMVDAPALNIKATPLLYNGVLYLSAPDHAWAMDARTGREIWHYMWTRNRGGSHLGNRGVALYGNTLYFETPDCNLVALEANTGREKWFKPICAAELLYYGTVAPTVVKDKLITGIGGDDLDMPAYLDARNLETGDLIWRWYVTPQKAGDPGLDSWPSLEAAQHGGGMTWQPITYDPDANLIYVTTGNPQPVIAYANRKGANLFTAAIVALNADTGKMSWYFQTSPHDTHDLDSTQVAVLLDIPGRGKYVAQANRAGRFVVVDRTTGKAIASTETIKTLQFLGTDERGQPVPNPAKDPSPNGTISTNSATNWYPPSYSPLTGLFYVNISRSFGIYYVYDLSDNPQGWGGGGGAGVGGRGGTDSQLKAMDVRTGQVRWATPTFGGGEYGVLSTAGNVVFTGGSGGFEAFNATTGEPLWASRVGTVSGSPITYILDGKQYVLTPVGGRVAAFVLNE